MSKADDSPLEPTQKSPLVSAIISLIFSLLIFSTFRFYGDWFASSPLNTIFGGFLCSWMFLFGLTSISNIEMFVFGDDFQAKFIPEILFSLTISTIAASVVHRVCATACILFSILGLYFINRISTKYHNKSAVSIENSKQKGNSKKHK